LNARNRKRLVVTTVQRRLSLNVQAVGKKNHVRY